MRSLYSRRIKAFRLRLHEKADSKTNIDDSKFNSHKLYKYCADMIDVKRIKTCWLTISC